MYHSDTKKYLELKLDILHKGSIKFYSKTITFITPRCRLKYLRECVESVSVYGVFCVSTLQYVEMLHVKTQHKYSS